METGFGCIVENIKKAKGFSLCVLAESLMKFFKYEINSDLYYAMGDGIIMTLPLAIDEDDYFFKGFSYIASVCFFSGAWEINYITTDPESFVKTLKEKWHEWADMNQPMPIFVGVRESSRVNFYILVGLDESNTVFSLADAYGNVVAISEKDLALTGQRFGCSTVDVPFNFLVKKEYYRKPERAFTNVVSNSIRNILNDGGINKLTEAILERKEDLWTYADAVSRHIEKYGLETDLYQKKFADALSLLGEKDGYDTFCKSAKVWNGVFNCVRKKETVSDNLLRQLENSRNEMSKYMRDSNEIGIGLSTLS